MKFFFQYIFLDLKIQKLHIYIKNLCSSPKKLKGFEGYTLTMIFFSEKAKILFGITHEKFQNPETIQNCIT